MLHAHLLLPLVFQCALPLVLAPQGLAFGFVLLRVESLAEEGKVCGSRVALGTLSDGHQGSKRAAPGGPQRSLPTGSVAQLQPATVAWQSCSVVLRHTAAARWLRWQQLRAIASNLQAADAAAALPLPPLLQI